MLISTDLAAHEGRPVFIEVTALTTEEKQEQINGERHYRLKWKIPPVMAAGQEPEIVLNGLTCETSPPGAGSNKQTGADLTKNSRHGNRSAQKLIGQKKYVCAESPTKLSVELNYPDINPALSTLILFNDINGEGRHFFTDPETTRVDISLRQNWLQVAKQYSVAGVEHILIGYDHLLFVICLMFLSGTLARMLITVTGFTLAHTITLALATLDLLSVPIVFAEMLIALSIVVLAAELIRHQRNNNYTSLTKRHPVLAASAFGLLHGIGFASVLADFGLPTNLKTSALLFFNLGVEIGQLIFVLVALALVYLITKIVTNSQHLKMLSSMMLYVIGAIASYWLFERLIDSL